MDEFKLKQELQALAMISEEALTVNENDKKKEESDLKDSPNSDRSASNRSSSYQCQDISASTTTSAPNESIASKEDVTMALKRENNKLRYQLSQLLEERHEISHEVIEIRKMFDNRIKEDRKDKKIKKDPKDKEIEQLKSDLDYSDNRNYALEGKIRLLEGIQENLEKKLEQNVCCFFFSGLCYFLFLILAKIFCSFFFFF